MTYVVPQLEGCNPRIEPTEYCVLVKMAEKQTKSTGGILFAPETIDHAEFKSTLARLVAVAPLAFTYAVWPPHARTPQVGDVVFVGKYPGEEVEGADGQMYRLCSDKEIKAVMERAKSPISVELQRALEGAGA